MFKIDESVDFESIAEIHSNLIESMIKIFILNWIALNQQLITFFWIKLKP